MAIKQTLTLCLFSFLALILTINSAEVAAPAPTMDCSPAFTDMAACLTFVESGSKIAKPEEGCCPGLKKVVKENVLCLCEVLKQSASFGVTLDYAKTLSLPKACNVKTPPFSECNITLPGMSPASSPKSSSTSTAASSPSTTPAVPTEEPSIVTGEASHVAPAPSKSMAGQIEVHPFMAIVVLASSVLVYRYSV